MVGVVTDTPQDPMSECIFEQHIDVTVPQFRRGLSRWCVCLQIEHMLDVLFAQVVEGHLGAWRRQCFFSGATS